MLRFDDCKHFRVDMMTADRAGSPLAILKGASVNTHTARRTLLELYGQFATRNESAKEIARNELCRGLVERLQLAEREAAELADLVVLARES
jgi:hypothetical protein